MEDRREQLLEVMRALYKRAKSQADFTAQLIADEAMVSVVWVYKLIGAEFKELRRSLKKTPPRSKSNESRLREENRDLRRRIREMENRYKVEVRNDYSGAIRHIEAQDEEIRVLRGRVKLLEWQLREAQVLVDVSPPEAGRDVMESSTEFGSSATPPDVIDDTINYSN